MRRHEEAGITLENLGDHLTVADAMGARANAETSQAVADGYRVIENAVRTRGELGAFARGAELTYDSTAPWTTDWASRWVGTEVLAALRAVQQPNGTALGRAAAATLRSFEA